MLLWAAVLIPLVQWPSAQTAGGLYDSVVDGLGLYRWHLFVAGVAAWMLSTGRLRPAHRALMRFFDEHGRCPPTTMSTRPPAPGLVSAPVHGPGDLVGASSGP